MTDEPDVTEQVVLLRRALKQPQPHISPGGDCAACVVGGLLDMTVQEIYSTFQGGDAEAPSRPETVKTLHHARMEGFLDRLITDTPVWSTPDYYMAFGPAAYLHNLEWFAYVRMAMDGGYYGVANVNFDQTGNGGKCPPTTDHLVLLCGARTVRIPQNKGARLEDQVLVSCSAKSSPDEEWVEVRDFLLNRGGYNTLWARPA